MCLWRSWSECFNQFIHIVWCKVKIKNRPEEAIQKNRITFTISQQCSSGPVCSTRSVHFLFLDERTSLDWHYVERCTPFEQLQVVFNPAFVPTCLCQSQHIRLNSWLQCHHIRNQDEKEANVVYRATVSLLSIYPMCTKKRRKSPLIQQYFNSSAESLKLIQHIILDGVFHLCCWCTFALQHDFKVYRKQPPTTQNQKTRLDLLSLSKWLICVYLS